MEENPTDPDDQVVQLPTITDTLDPAPDGDEDVTITVCQEVFNYAGAIVDTACVNIPVTVENPCLDKSRVKIVCPDNLTALTYKVSSGEEIFSSHELCTVETTPVQDPYLCGDLEYSVRYDGKPITDTTVMGYLPDTNQFTADTEDGSLIGETKTYTIDVTFKDFKKSVDYPNVSEGTSDGPITFTGPCADPAIASVNVPSPAWAAWQDTYTDKKVFTQAEPFTATPGYCALTVECVSVTRVDNQPVVPEVTCATFTYDMGLKQLYTQASESQY